MKTIYKVSIAAVLFGLTVTLFAGGAQTVSRNREIAATLLELHHSWATNGYNPPGLGVPKISAEYGHPDAATFYPMGGWVQFDYRTNGMIWFGRFGISRTDTNTTMWTVYESGTPIGTNSSPLAWRHDLLTVSGEP